MSRPYRVYKIENGTVIDHIASPMALKILEILKIEEKGIISIGMNFSSEKTGKKDIIKVENVYLDKVHIDRIALLAPHATINYIKNGTVVEKAIIQMPEEITSVLKCPNPICVSNHYSDCDTKFIVKRYDENSTVVECNYCERETQVYPEMIK